MTEQEKQDLLKDLKTPTTGEGKTGLIARIKPTEPGKSTRTTVYLPRTLARKMTYIAWKLEATNSEIFTVLAKELVDTWERERGTIQI